MNVARITCRACRTTCATVPLPDRCGTCGASDLVAPRRHRPRGTSGAGRAMLGLALAAVQVATLLAVLRILFDRR